MIQFTTAVWADLLAQSTAAGRAGVFAGKNPDTLELLDASDAVIRTITVGAWSVGAPQGGYYPAVPGSFTDSALGSGTPVAAVLKAAGVEVARMSCGTGAGNFYRLVANVVANVPIRRGPFQIFFAPPSTPTATVPVNTVAPTITPTTVYVGTTLFGTNGTYTNSPTGFDYQWLRDGVPIPGATNSAYTTVEADRGCAIRKRVTPSNAAGQGAAATSAPVYVFGFAGYDDPQSITRGDTIDLNDLVVGGVPPYTNFAIDAGSWPGVTVSPDGILAVAAGASLGQTSQLTIGVDDSAAAASLPVLGITSTAAVAEAPFTFAQGFKEGDILAGQSVVVAGVSTAQVIPWSTWPDGSVKLAWVSGRTTTTPGARKDLQLAIGTPAGGASQSLSTLRATLLSGSIQVGAYETVDLPTLIAGAPFDLFGSGSSAIFEGPHCSYWIWRKRIAGTPHLELFVPIRMYSGGHCEMVTPWLQNGDFLVPSPQTYSAVQVTITLAGTQRFSESITLYHHTVVPLVKGGSKARSYWYGTDPQVAPRHDVDYLMAAGFTLNHRKIQPSEATLNALNQTYTPGWRGDTTIGMAQAGGNPHIGPLPKWQALWLASDADARAYECMIANGLSAGARSAHYRDSGGYGQDTGRYLRQSFYPKASLSPQESPVIPTGTGNPNTIDTAHQPSLAYLPWVLTGDVFFLEEQIAWVTHNYIYYNWFLRGEEEGYYDLYSRETRGMAWAMRSLGHLLGSCPDNHTLRGEWVAQAQFNLEKFYGQAVTGTLPYLQMQNNLGVIHYNVHPSDGTTPIPSPYSDPIDIGPSPTGWYMAPWMNHFMVLAFKTMKDLKVPISGAAQTALEGLLQFTGGFAAKFTSGSSGWPRTHLAPYSFPAMDTYAGGGDWTTDFGEAWTIHRTDLGYADVTPAPGDPILYWSRYGTGGWQTATAGALSGQDVAHCGITVAAIAVACEEGVPGAADAWANLISAPNWSTANMGDMPTWAVTPRNL